MPRRVLGLTLAVLATCIWVSELRHQSRSLFAQLERLRAERDALNIEWGQLLLEQATWSEHRRVEQIARARLDMNLPARDRIMVIHLGEQTASANQPPSPLAGEGWRGN